jgi:hypothetical protein
MAKKKIKLEGPIEDSNQDLPIGGLGDMIAKVTDTLGIEKCEGCEKRQTTLNHLFPWINTTREITQEEKDFMARVQSSHIIQNDDVNKLFSFYNDLFNSKVKRCNCPGLIGKMIQRINERL